MTQEIASISFKVSTSELEKGSKALNDLQQAASRTDQSVDELNSTFKQSEPSHKAVARSISELTEKQRETVVSVERMNAKFRDNTLSLKEQIQSVKKAGDASNQFASILKKVNQYYEDYKIDGSNFIALESQIKSAIRATEAGNTKVADSFHRQIESIQKVTGSTAKLTAIRENLSKVYQKGNIDTERYQVLLEEITNRTNGLSAAEKELSTLKDSFLHKMHEQVFLYGATKTEMLAYKAAQMGIAREAAPIIAQMKKQEERTARLAAEQKQAAQSARELAREKQAAAAAEAREAQAKENFIQALKNEAEAIGKTKSELLQMKAAQLGVGQQVEPYIAKLKQQEQAYRNGAITIGQYRNAMRQLPMQMTDIVTSLASGMPVWLVMVQQGGQIKDSFGGIGNSFRAVLSLITPMRIAMLGLVGVTGALAIAAYKGSQEFTEYNKQLILTGNYAGKTASQLDSLAKQLSGNGITQYRMADALAKVVGSGAFSGNQVGIVADISAKMEKAVGQDIDKTIEHFKRLKDDPVKAVTELNNSLHFLTAKQYEQIAAAEAQGRTEKAAELATKAYAEVGVRNPYSLSGTRNFAYLTSLQLGKPPKKTYDYSVKFKIENKSPNSTLIAIPYKACNAWRPRHGWLQFTVIKNIVISNDIVTVYMYMQPTNPNNESDYEGFVAPTAIIHVFEVFGAEEQAGEFGVIIDNATDYTKITNKSKLGFIVWSYSGVVNDGMVLPSNLPNNASQSILAYWDHDSAVVEYDHKNNRIITNGHSLNMDIVITQGGFNPPAKIGDWGLFIFNDNGEPVLTHHYPPIKEPKYVRLGAAHVKVFDRPMITLGQYGLFFTGSTGERKAWNAGLQMRNGAINIARGSYSGVQGDHKSGQGNAFYSECNTIMLNRDDYF